MKSVVILPCYNEAATIGNVIDEFKKQLPNARIVVFDNNSIDQSVFIAKQKNVEVFTVRRQGKGNVVRSAFELLDSDIYVMTDADGTYPAEEVHELIAPIIQGEADMVVGTRLEQANKKTLRPLHQIGNRLLLVILNLVFRTQLNDILSGYRVFNRKFVQNIPLLSSGFEIETELTLQALERRFVIKEIPIQYQARQEGSSSKLRSFHDGGRILFTIFSLLRDYRPMTFFSSIAFIFGFFGMLAGLAVVKDYVENGLVERVPMAILSTLLIILSVICFLSGLIVATMNRRFREFETLLQRKNQRRS